MTDPCKPQVVDGRLPVEFLAKAFEEENSAVRWHLYAEGRDRCQTHASRTWYADQVWLAGKIPARDVGA